MQEWAIRISKVRLILKEKTAKAKAMMHKATSVFSKDSKEAGVIRGEYIGK